MLTEHVFIYLFIFSLCLLCGCAQLLASFPTISLCPSVCMRLLISPLSYVALCGTTNPSRRPELARPSKFYSQSPLDISGVQVDVARRRQDNANLLVVIVRLIIYVDLRRPRTSGPRRHSVDVTMILLNVRSAPNRISGGQSQVHGIVWSLVHRQPHDGRTR